MSKFIKAWNTNDTPLLINIEQIAYMYEEINDEVIKDPIIVMSNGKELRLFERHNGNFMGLSEEIAPEVSWKS
jgi:hypothetical protein